MRDLAVLTSPCIRRVPSHSGPTHAHAAHARRGLSQHVPFYGLGPILRCTRSYRPLRAPELRRRGPQVWPWCSDGRSAPSLLLTLARPHGAAGDAARREHYHGLRPVALLACGSAGCGRADTVARTRGRLLGALAKTKPAPSRSPSSSRTVLLQLAAPDVRSRSPARAPARRVDDDNATVRQPHSTHALGHPICHG